MTQCLFGRIAQLDGQYINSSIVLPGDVIWKDLKIRDQRETHLSIGLILCDYCSPIQLDRKTMRLTSPCILLAYAISLALASPLTVPADAQSKTIALKRDSDAAPAARVIQTASVNNADASCTASLWYGETWWKDGTVKYGCYASSIDCDRKVPDVKAYALMGYGGTTWKCIVPKGQLSRDCGAEGDWQCTGYCPNCGDFDAPMGVSVWLDR